MMQSQFTASSTDITADLWHNEIDLPSLHVWGTNNSSVPPNAIELLRNKFVSPVTYKHDKVHVIAGNSAVTAVSSLYHLTFRCQSLSDYCAYIILFIRQVDSSILYSTLAALL